MKSTATKPPTTSARRPIPAKSAGTLSAKQKQVLIMVATEGFKLQDPGISFDDWRHDQVMDAVQRPGLTACDQEHYSDLMGHFLTSAGRESEALNWFMKHRKNPERQLAWRIAKTLADHTFLAQASAEQVAASTSARSLKRRQAKREALQDHCKGPITYDYLLSIVRDKTRRPTLTLGPDLAASLAERCDLRQLYQILYTLTNRIAEREGTGLTQDRNKSQRTESAKRHRSPHEIAVRDFPA
jgi:hypothetical protein